MTCTQSRSLHGSLLFMTLSNCFLLFCVCCINVFFLSDVSKHASVTVTEHFIPTVAGKRKLVASLDCRQLTQVHGVTDIQVHESQWIQSDSISIISNCTHKTVTLSHIFFTRDCSYCMPLIWSLFVLFI